MTSSLAAYRAAAPVLPRTLRREDVGAAAWFGLVRDGVVRVVWGDVAIAADLVDTPELRAVAVASLVPARGVLGRRTAAWVHAGGEPPPRVEVLVRAGGRRTDPHPARVAAEAVLAPADVVRVGGLRVTSVERTAIDVARILPPAEAVCVLRALQGVGLQPERARAHLASLRGYRGIRQADATLRELTRG